MPLEPLVDIPASLAVLRDQWRRSDMVKLDADLARYERVIESDKPDVIVECGTWMGGSARWFAQHGCDVVTIDSVRQWSAADGEGITWITGDSVSPIVVDWVTELVDGRRTMVVLDSDHSSAHVAAEIRTYGPLVSVGCHLVVEDGIVRWMPEGAAGGSPLDAIEEVLVDDPGFVRDEATEAMFDVSMYPGGWWVRVDGVAGP